MPQPPLSILLTNDDGILSPGLLALRLALAEIGEVSVVAPDAERSGASHAVTLGQPLHPREIVHRGERIGIALNGYPADCVKYAVCEHLKRRPDLVVAGINPGPNAGVAAFYSGTVAAAMEGAFFGIPAVAVSTDLNGVPADFPPLAGITRDILVRMRELVHGGERIVLNVNFPALPPAAFKGLRITRQGVLGFQDRFERRAHPRGEPGFYLSGDHADHGESLDIDVNALKAGWISVTPLKQDLTHDALFEQFKSL